MQLGPCRCRSLFPGLHTSASNQTERRETSMDLDTRPILFVVGTPRSGTSLLQTLLVCHPEATPIPESYVFADLTPTIGRADGLPPLLRRAIPETLSVQAAERHLAGLKNRRPPPDLDWGQLIRASMASGQVHTGQLIQRFLAAYATANTRLLIEKTPAHLYFIDEIRRILPQAQFIQIVRDPRAVVYSFAEMIRSARNESAPLYGLARAWRTGVETGRRQGIPFVRYEDLVRDPHAVIMPIAERLNLNFPARYLEQQSRVSDQTRPSEDQWNMQTRQPITQQRIHRYRDHLATDDVRLVETICAKELARYGYERTESPLSSHRVRREQITFMTGRVMKGIQQLRRKLAARIRHSQIARLHPTPFTSDRRS